jgi:hypothetical protein
MGDEDAVGVDMQRLLGFGEAAPSAADQGILERLLDGGLDAASVPPGYGRLARLLAAATAPATSEELAGEQQALATFAAVMRSRPSTLVPRRTAVPGRVFTIKAAAAALLAVLAVGGVAAAATGLLAGQASPVADQAPATTDAGAAGQGVEAAASVDLPGTAQAGLCRAWEAGQGGDSGSRADTPAFQALVAAAGGADKVAAYCGDVTAGGRGRGSAVGPDAAAAARAGLCRTWHAGQEAGGDGPRVDSVAFQALVAAAGGAEKVAAYCADVAVGSGAGPNGQGQASPAGGSGPSTTVSPPSSGPPVPTGPPASTGPGQGRGQGGPPTTTG